MTTERPSLLLYDNDLAAEQAGLRYVNATDRGFTRRRAGTGFVYLDTRGKRISDASQLARIRSLAIPPAWADVWICPTATGHIQATGRDARGRKQFRYHTRWREIRDYAKYAHLATFVRSLPTIRERVTADLALRGLCQNKVLASLVCILENTFIRIGNEEYAAQNDSYGLTTLRRRHVDVEGSTIDIHFRGKSGQLRRVRFTDRRLARIVQRLEELPGQRLFQYIDEDGECRKVDSDDVNEYLRTLSGKNITAKDFRTWAATYTAALALQTAGDCMTKAEMKRKIKQAIGHAATVIGNTVAVCRRAYVHPALVETYERGDLCVVMAKCRRKARRNCPRGLDVEEAALLLFLEAEGLSPATTSARAAA